ncbi:phage tail domain-containing protein [Clostridium sporogenes]|uniref:phage tail domain-containing protein n=1 Tax=Clostridium sporogenes TaxID=1509 RepID=UPI0005EDE00F|nr:phage tail domain-containing protein [Clostridium sporogenes]MCW6061617.1 phage tail family protein [Clostridium sporogenes]MCW6069809.1 phage tail family protein [Clostridium sporogenes]MCW6122539.1 phage tail family protein [Clostridium sporogenes]NFF78870.1 phage tail family protein [Clostridium sporogenes]NFU88851.1 phage tail family protein [Clostridium sporogenes]
MEIILKNKFCDEITFNNYSSFIINSFVDDGIKIVNVTNKSMLQDGQQYINSTLNIRQLRLKYTILADSQLELENKRLKLNQILNPKNGELEIQLIKDDKHYKINAIPDAIPSHEDSGCDFDEGNIIFVCNNPFWKNYKDEKINIALWKGDFHFPLIIPKPKGITMGHREPSLIVNVNNKGQVSTGMIIEFRARGTLKNPSLFNVNTRELLKINKGMIEGEKFIINTNYGQKKILQELNGETNDILNYLDIIGGGDTFLQLDIGDNLFRYDAEENLDNLEINIYFNPKYLGV